jgi:hypothetical protein
MAASFTSYRRPNFSGPTLFASDALIPGARWTNDSLLFSQPF